MIGGHEVEELSVVPVDDRRLPLHETEFFALFLSVVESVIKFDGQPRNTTIYRCCLGEGQASRKALLGLEWDQSFELLRCLRFHRLRLNR